MLDLDPAVELEEEERAAVDDELDRSRAPVADRAAECDRGLEHRLAQRGIELRRRRLLEHLLMAPLHRAVPLAEGDDVPVRVGEQLNLDVPRPLEVALEVEPPVAERADRLALGGLEGVVELGRVTDDAHTAPAPARGGLDDEREADLLSRPLGQGRDAGLARDPLRRELVPAEPQRLRRRPDPRQPGGFHRLGEAGVLGEEPVAGMDRVRARLLRCPDVLLGVEVARDLDRLVGGAAVERARVVGRDHGHGCDPALTAGAEDAQRDLAAVRNEQLRDRPRAELRDAGKTRLESSNLGRA